MRRQIRGAVCQVPSDTLDQLELGLDLHGTPFFPRGSLQEADFAVATLRMLSQTPEDVRLRLMSKQKDLGRFYAALFQQAQDAGLIRAGFNLSALRMLLLGALNWSPEWYDDNGLSPDELVDQMVELMRHGVMAEQGHTRKSDARVRSVS